MNENDAIVNTLYKARTSGTFFFCLCFGFFTFLSTLDREVSRGLKKEKSGRLMVEGREEFTVKVLAGWETAVTDGLEIW